MCFKKALLHQWDVGFPLSHCASWLCKTKGNPIKVRQMHTRLVNVVRCRYEPLLISPEIRFRVMFLRFSSGNTNHPQKNRIRLEKDVTARTVNAVVDAGRCSQLVESKIMETTSSGNATKLDYTRYWKKWNVFKRACTYFLYKFSTSGCCWSKSRGGK